jgi:hypothetical protein
LPDEQRSHAHTIANQQEPAPWRVPERDGELAVEPRDEIVAPLLVGVNQRLGIGLGLEAVAEGLELPAQLDVVEDLAVEDDPDRVVLVGHGLIARGEIDDAEARMRQCYRAELAHPGAVGTAMTQRAQRGFTRERACRRNSIETENTGNATHVFLLPLASPAPRSAWKAGRDCTVCNAATYGGRPHTSGMLTQL